MQLLACSVWLVLLGASVNACADARASDARGPDDEAGWTEVTCRDSHDHCNDKAAETCGGAYETAKNEGRYDVGPSAPYYSGHMLIKCRKR